MSLEQPNDVAVPERVPSNPEHIVSPEENVRQQYSKAMEAAAKVVALADKEWDEKSGSKKKLSGVALPTAHRMLDTMTWDRNFFDISTQQYPYQAVPNEVMEAERLLYTSYQPSQELQAMQIQGYEKACELIDEKKMEDLITKWGAMSDADRLREFASFGEGLCSAFGFEKPIGFSYVEGASHGAEAFYVNGQNTIAVPKDFFSKRSFVDALELGAHEVNHGYQEKLIKDKNANIPDVEWFKLSNERESFLPRQEFNTDHNRYMSLPTEQDSYNAQKLFRAQLEDKISPILNRKLEESGLPMYSEVKKMMNIYATLDEFDMIGIPMTEEGLSSRLNEEEMKYLVSFGGDFSATYQKISPKVALAKETLAGIL